MKAKYNKQKIVKTALAMLLSFMGCAGLADTVLFSFNDEIVPVESKGMMYNIPRFVFNSHFGHPEYGRRIDLGEDLMPYRVYDPGAGEASSVGDVSRLRPTYFNYGGAYYEQYGEAYALLGTETQDGAPLSTWTTLPLEEEQASQEPAAVVAPRDRGFLVDRGETTIVGKMLPTESEEVFVIDDGRALYWLKKLEKGEPQKCFTEEQKLWQAPMDSVGSTEVSSLVR